MQFYLQGQPQPTNGTHRPYNGSTTRTGWSTCAKIQVSSPGEPRAAAGSAAWAQGPRGGGGGAQRHGAPPRPPPLQPHYARWTPNCGPFPAAGGAQAVPSSHRALPRRLEVSPPPPVFLGTRATPPPCPRGPGAREGQLGVLQWPGLPPPPQPQSYARKDHRLQRGGSMGGWGRVSLVVWGAQGSGRAPPIHTPPPPQH